MSDPFYDTPLTKQEYERLLDELAERLKNLVYAIAREKASEALDHLGIGPGTALKHIEGEGKITVNFWLGFIQNDLAEIVAGLRRNAK